jgi:hypothetical protein
MLDEKVKYLFKLKQYYYFFYCMRQIISEGFMFFCTQRSEQQPQQENSESIFFCLNSTHLARAMLCSAMLCAPSTAQGFCVYSLFNNATICPNIALETSNSVVAVTIGAISGSSLGGCLGCCWKPSLTNRECSERYLDQQYLFIIRDFINYEMRNNILPNKLLCIASSTTASLFVGTVTGICFNTGVDFAKTTTLAAISSYSIVTPVACIPVAHYLICNDSSQVHTDQVLDQEPQRIFIPPTQQSMNNNHSSRLLKLYETIENETNQYSQKQNLTEEDKNLHIKIINFTLVEFILSIRGSDIRNFLKPVIEKTYPAIIKNKNPELLSFISEFFASYCNIEDTLTGVLRETASPTRDSQLNTILNLKSDKTERIITNFLQKQRENHHFASTSSSSTSPHPNPQVIGNSNISSVAMQHESELEGQMF